MDLDVVMGVVRCVQTLHVPCPEDSSWYYMSFKSVFFIFNAFARHSSTNLNIKVKIRFEINVKWLVVFFSTPRPKKQNAFTKSAQGNFLLKSYIIFVGNPITLTLICWHIIFNIFETFFVEELSIVAVTLTRQGEIGVGWVQVDPSTSSSSTTASSHPRHLLTLVPLDQERHWRPLPCGCWPRISFMK